MEAKVALFMWSVHRRGSILLLLRPTSLMCANGLMGLEGEQNHEMHPLQGKNEEGIRTFSY